MALPDYIADYYAGKTGTPQTNFQFSTTPNWTANTQRTFGEAAQYGLFPGWSSQPTGPQGATKFAWQTSSGSGNSSGSGSGGGGRGYGSGGGRVSVKYNTYKPGERPDINWESGVYKPKSYQPMNLQVYRPGQYTGGSEAYRQAGVLANAKVNEAMSQGRITRQQANTLLEQNMRQMALSQSRDTEANRQAQAGAIAQQNNAALNRGMGFGQGYQATQANTNLAYNKQLNDLMDQYLVQRQNAMAERNAQYYGAGENERLARMNRYADLIGNYTNLNNAAFQRYLGQEGLNQAGVGSYNDRAAALWGQNMDIEGLLQAAAQSRAGANQNMWDVYLGGEGLNLDAINSANAAAAARAGVAY